MNASNTLSGRIGDRDFHAQHITKHDVLGNAPLLGPCIVSCLKYVCRHFTLVAQEIFVAVGMFGEHLAELSFEG